MTRTRFVVLVNSKTQKKYLSVGQKLHLNASKSKANKKNARKSFEWLVLLAKTSKRFFSSLIDLKNAGKSFLFFSFISSTLSVDSCRVTFFIDFVDRKAKKLNCFFHTRFGEEAIARSDWNIRIRLTERNIVLIIAFEWDEFLRSVVRFFLALTIHSSDKYTSSGA